MTRPKALISFTLLVIFILALIILSVVAGASLSPRTNVACHAASLGASVPATCQVR